MLSNNAIQLLQKRYCRNGEEPLNVFRRSAHVLSGGDETLEKELVELQSKGIFLPNSPALFNAGFEHPMLHACCALGIEDNMESIAKFGYTMQMMFKYGAGVGCNYSYLREKDAPLSNGGTSSGVLSLLDVVNKQVDYVKQGGYRRGAAMSILFYWHPEAIDFIGAKIKGGLENMNLSIMVNDNFMLAVERSEEFDIVSMKQGVVGRMNAADMFDQIAWSAWKCGCPGLLFFDRINKDNPYYPDLIIDTTNPCSESPIPKDSLCTLGSINLSKFVRNGEFNFDRFGSVVEISEKALLNMNKFGWYPFDFMEVAMDKYNPVGLGLMGFADACIKMEVMYDSDGCIDFIRAIGEIYKRISDGVAEGSLYKRIIAPTGSLSILADCSSGIEPVFADVFERNLTVGKIEETRDIYKSKYCRVSHDISPEWHLKVQAEWQSWVDGGISKTINMPHSATYRDVRNAYLQAWKNGVKGVTVYRDMSKGEQVLYRKPSCSDGECML
jgi:ribonucleoside-diphosphate reductase alpha chain